MKHAVHTVENPEHLTLDMIKKKYWDNYVLVSNTEEGGIAGIVRYYCYANEPELTEIIMEMDRIWRHMGTVCCTMSVLEGALWVFIYD